jgi:hypothetical protein
MEPPVMKLNGEERFFSMYQGFQNRKGGERVRVCAEGLMREWNNVGGN